MSSSLYIDGVDRTSDLDRESFVMNQELDFKGSELQCRLSGISTLPTENQVVEFYDDSTLKFSGRIMRVNHSSPLPKKVADIQVSDWYEALIGELVRQTYASKSLSYIIQDIVREKVLEDDLKLMLQFEEGTGTTAEDSTANGHDGELDSGVTWDTVNYAVEFDGTTDAKITITDDADLDFTTECSLCVDVNLTALDKTILVKQGGSKTPYRIMVDSLGDIVFVVSDGSNYDTLSTTTQPIDAGTQYTIVCTFNAGMAKIYVNGVLLVSGMTSISSLGITTGDLEIGPATSSVIPGGLFDVLAIQGVAFPSGGAAQTNLEGTLYRMSAYSRELSAVEARRWHVDILEVKAPTRLIESGEIVIESAGFNYEYPADCFSKLCRDLELTWRIDEKMFVRFIDKAGTASVATYEEDDGESMIQGEISVDIDRSQIRNAVYVRGGVYPGTWRIDPIEANGVTTFFPLPYQFSGFEMFTNTPSLCADVQSWYKMNDASGNLADQKAANTLTASNLTYSQTGQVGNGIDFNGTTSSARKTAATHVTGDTNHSMTAWIEPDVHDTTERYICGIGDFSAGRSTLSLIQSAGTYYLRHRFSGAIVTDTDVGDLSGAFHFVGMSYDNALADGRTLRVYLDGTLVSTTVVSAPSVAAGVVEIGGNNGSNVFDGVIDEVTFFNYALSDQEHQSIYLLNDTTSALLLRSGLDFINDSGFDGYYNYTEKQYRFDSAPSNAAILYATGSPQIPVLSVRTNAASIARYGRRELEIEDQAADSLVTARTRAAAEVSRRKDSVITVSFPSLRQGRKPGDVITLNLPSFDVPSRDFIVQKVTTQYFLPTEQSSIRHLHTLQCVTTVNKDWLDFLRDSFLRGKRRISPNEGEAVQDLIDHTEAASIADAHSIATPVDHVEAATVADDHPRTVIASGGFKWSNDAGTTPDKLRWDIGDFG
jgi:hypothetical protein